MASPQQVFDWQSSRSSKKEKRSHYKQSNDENSMIRYDNGIQDIPWKLPETKEVIVWDDRNQKDLLETLKPLLETLKQNEQQQSSSSSSSLSLLKTGVSTVYHAMAYVWKKPILSNDEQYDDYHLDHASYHQENDDALRSTGKDDSMANMKFVQWKDSIVNQPLTIECIQFIRQQQIIAHGQQGRTDPFILAVSEWHSWIVQQGQARNNDTADAIATTTSTTTTTTTTVAAVGFAVGVHLHRDEAP